MLSVLGSTGSIGTQSLQVARKRDYKISALAAFSNVELIEKQAREFKPKIAALVDEKAASELKIRLADTDIKVLAGLDGVCEAAQEETCDTVLNSVVGMAGLKPTLAALQAKKKIALANKETLVAGGRLVYENAEKYGADILPVDSEHSAIFQCLQACHDKKQLKKLILTASGGPFFGKTADELKNVTVSDALKHPNWSMGAKITIDSATMMNKGLELIEAVWLFNMDPKDIDIVIHRESIVHSLIEFDDNSVLAQLGLPDMRIPIQYALTYPDRFPSPVGELNLAQCGKLTFFEPDYDTFKCINLCRKAISMGGLYPAAVNSANEQANKMFREGKIGFLDIYERVASVIEKIPPYDAYNYDDVMEIDSFSRELVKNF